MQKLEHQNIKQFVEAFALVSILPLWAAYEIQARMLGHTYAWLALSQRASQWAGVTGVYRRRTLFKHILAKMGDNVSIGMGTILTKATIELGNSVYLGSYCIVGDVRVGSNTLISDHVSLLSGNHEIAPDLLIKDQSAVYRTLRIGQDCWVGSRAVILADLADHCVVGAGSVVTKPVSEYLIVAGNPARPIGDRRQRKVIHPC